MAEEKNPLNEAFDDVVRQMTEDEDINSSLFNNTVNKIEAFKKVVEIGKKIDILKEEQRKWLRIFNGGKA